MIEKMFRLIIFVVIMLAITVPAIAQETETPVPPTSTWEPLYKTPTPAPPESYTCPTGMPSGWGTSTPDPWWQINCANCLLTQTPQGTGYPTWVPTTTGEPVTPTPRPLADYELRCNYWQIGDGVKNYCYGIKGKQIDIYFDNICDTQGAGCGSQPMLKVYIDFSCVEGSTCDFTHKQFQLYYDVAQIGQVTYYAPNSGAVALAWQATDNSQEQYVHSCPAGSPGCEFSQDWSGIKNVDVVWGDDVAWTNAYFSSPTREGVYTNMVWIHYSMGAWDPTPTPYPTFTPTAGYCGAVNGGGAGGGGDDGWGSLPIIRLGPATCAALDEISIDLSDFPIIGELIPLIYFPGASICFSPVEFGELEILGMEINLDLIAAVMAGIVAIRIFARS